MYKLLPLALVALLTLTGCSTSASAPSSVKSKAVAVTSAQAPTNYDLSLRVSDSGVIVGFQPSYTLAGSTSSISPAYLSLSASGYGTRKLTVTSGSSRALTFSPSCVRNVIDDVTVTYTTGLTHDDEGREISIKVPHYRFTSHVETTRTLTKVSLSPGESVSLSC